MAVEKHDGGTMVTGKHIGMLQVHSQLGALAISIRMPASHPGLMSRIAKEIGSSKRTKKGVLEDLVVWMYANDMKLTAQWGTVERALGAERAAKLRRKVEK